MENRRAILSALRFYEQASLPALLAEIDKNTILQPEYLTDRYPRAEGEVAMASVLHKPASMALIAVQERRLGMAIPRDIQAYFLLANGADAVSEACGFFNVRLPRVEDMFYEAETEYMDKYTFMLLPEFYALDIDWPPVERGLAMYKEEITGSRHVWVLDAAKIAEAKAALEQARGREDEQGRALIDAAIVRYYGSRRVLDEMREYCLYQVWGKRDEERLFPSMRSYLAYVALRSRNREEG